ncbi:MAG: hypothetical protein PF692_09575, partial [Kiritimatiellae bacterium]|jgi:hypothetical protein|nr:hypothetical protein [Kiritimatiellia bacterium]
VINIEIVVNGRRGRISSSPAGFASPALREEVFEERERRGISPCWQYNIKLHNGRVSVPADRKAIQPKNQGFNNYFDFELERFAVILYYATLIFCKII